MHAALLHTGNVMFFAGSGNVKKRQESPDFGSLDKKIYTSVVWNPTITPTNGDENFFHPVAIKGDNGKVFDLFCGGDSFLADGRLLSAGGTLHSGHVPAARTPYCMTQSLRNGLEPTTWLMADGTPRWSHSEMVES